MDYFYSIDENRYKIQVYHKYALFVFFTFLSLFERNLKLYKN